jgi:hypothetical protein
MFAFSLFVFAFSTREHKRFVDAGEVHKIS